MLDTLFTQGQRDNSLAKEVPAKEENTPKNTGNGEAGLSTKILLVILPILATLILSYFTLGYNSVSKAEARGLIEDRMHPIEIQMKIDRDEFKSALKENYELLREVDRKQATQAVQIDMILKNMVQIRGLAVNAVSMSAAPPIQTVQQEVKTETKTTVKETKAVPKK